MYKPLTWKPDQPGFVGGTSGRPFIVKNLFELKNAQRVLFEGNILENTWGGFSQKGFAIVLTPKISLPMSVRFAASPMSPCVITACPTWEAAWK